jgi:hypothetical protein
MTSSHFESIYQRLKLAQLFPQGFDFRAGVMSGKVGGAQQRGKLLVMDYTDLQVLGDPGRRIPKVVPKRSSQAARL